MITKTYKAFVKIRDILSRKKIQNFSLVIMTFLGTLVVMNSAYAADTLELTADAPAIYEESQGIASGIAGPSINDLSVTETHKGTLAVSGLAMLLGSENVIAFDNAVEPENQSYISRVGLLGVTEDALYSMLENPPSTNVYAQLAEDWVPGYDNTEYSTYAQDGGYDYLVSVGMADLWGKTRNIAYIAFVAILIVAGFMIMFRQKIGGQMAVTVFNTIPNVLVSLLLVTFSFAIVGLLMNAGALLVNVFASILDLNSSNTVVIEGPFSLASGLFGVAGSQVSLTVGLVGLAAGIVGYLMVGAALTGGGAVLLTGVVMALVAIVVIGIIIMASLKVFFTLVMAYLNILIDTILGPIYLAFAALPGQEKIRGDWIRRVIKNILTFPVVFLIVNLGMYLISQNLQISFPSGLSGGNITGVTATNGAGLFVYILALYLMFLAAESPKILDDFLPQSGGKGAQAAIQGAMKNIPILKGFGG